MQIPRDFRFEPAAAPLAAAVLRISAIRTFLGFLLGAIGMSVWMTGALLGIDWRALMGLSLCIADISKRLITGYDCNGNQTPTRSRSHHRKRRTALPRKRSR